MRKEYSAEELRIENDLPGMSLKSVQEHFKLYQGYVKKTNEIQAKLETADKSDVSGVYSFYGELRRQETFAVNGMKLHEAYFNQLEGRGMPSGALEQMIVRDFGSVDAWKSEMIATGMSARGWAILAFDFKDNRFHVYGADAQNVGAVWGAIPLVALDVYEHAYFMDHGTSRKPYIEAFFSGLNWEHPNKLIADYGLDTRAPR